MFFPDYWLVLPAVPVFKNIGEMSIMENYCPASLLLVVRKVFEKLGNYRLVYHLKKCGLFSDLQYNFKYSQSTGNLLTDVSEIIARAFDRSVAT